MNADFKPAVDTGKVLNLKFWITTFIVVIVVIWGISKLMKVNINPQTGEVKAGFKKKVSLNQTEKK